ncbi:MAG TPA: PKD domain-containing protein, partial [Actinomycetota bacterium]|nr:PKD domain-containing protein [Actinomycetota bacterium]
MSDKAKRRVEAVLSAIFVLSLFFVAAVLIFSGGSATARQFATLRILDGSVQVRHDGGSVQLANDGEALRAGDIVETGTDGRAAIEYFDGSVSRLDFDTTFELETLETIDDEDDSRLIELSQLDGNSYNRVVDFADAASRFTIRTTTATASVRGTVYAVLVNVDGSTTIATLEGLVSAGVDEGALDIPAGKMVVVAVGGSVGPLLDIPEGLLNSGWISFNRCALDAAAGCEPPESDGLGPDDEPGDGRGGPRPASDGENVGEPPTDGDDAVPPGINRQPDAGFIASPDSGAAPLRVDFTDTSVDPDGDSLARAWDFGDGSSQNAGTTPTHTYVRRGSYTVTLVVTDPDGASDTQTRVISVGTRADDEAPVVRITSRPDDPTYARNAHFRFRSSEAGTGFVCSLDGDRQPCGPGSPVETGNDVVGSVDYSDLSTGPHSFRVSMTDASGNSGSDSYSWTILPRASDFDHIVISPSNATIELGESQNYTAEAFDTNGGSMGNVTAETKFTIQPSGSCSGNTCTPTSAGSHTVVGKFSGDSDAATLVVE